MKWTDEDVKLVEKFIEIRNKGFYCDGGQLTQVYNRVLEKSVPTTNCGSCMRQRIGELETALTSFKKTLEVDSPQEENNASDEPQKRVSRAKTKK